MHNVDLAEIYHVVRRKGVQYFGISGPVLDWEGSV
jgi:hypothetical protein